MNMLRRSLVVGLCLLSTLAGPAAAPQVGQPFIDLSQEKLEGTLPDLKGKVVLVDFWASWCVPCRHSFPALQEIYSKYKDQGLVVLGISLDEEKSAMDGFLKKTKVDFPIVRDGKGKLAEKLSVSTIPSSFLLDRSGKLIAAHEGYEGDKTKREYAAEVEKALAAK
jgi:thiol-disulfide isomerase/thioredoxin